jgi:DNA-binding PadR family transcriptional regulator
MGHGFGSERFMRHMHGPKARFFERGGIKFAILELLKDKPRHGYDIIRDMEERSMGFYSPSPGVVYPTLQALEDQDLVTSVADTGKKVYSVTDAGLAYLEQHKEQAAMHRERWAAHWSGGPHAESWSAMRELKDTLGEVMPEVMQAVRKSAGDPAKMKDIRDVLHEAARKIGEISKR